MVASAVFSALTVACLPIDPPSNTGTETGTTSASADDTNGGSASSTPTTQPAPTDGTSGGIDPGTSSSSTSGSDDGTSITNDPTGDSTSEAPACDPNPGTAMGECRSSTDPLGLCDEGLRCMATNHGTFCQPTCDACRAGEQDACIDDLSNVPPAGESLCLGGQGCVLPCNDDDDCANPLVCVEAKMVDDAAKICVWPFDLTCTPNPGETFGACGPGDQCTGMPCLVTEIGTMCAPPCSAREGGHACLAVLGHAERAFECVNDGMSCGIPCELTGSDTSTCGGGTVCDPSALVCVWPTP